MSTLKTDYKGDILDLTQNDRRCFEMIQNQDGTVSFNDVTEYEQEGDNFGPLDMNATNEEVNRIAENLLANGVDFKFAYNGTDYGYTINGTFYPFKTRHTDTFSPTSRANNLDMGVFHTKRYVDTTGVPNINDETQTISAVYTSGNGLDLGATNKKRFIKTNNLMVIPTATKSITANGSNIDVKDYAKATVAVPNSYASLTGIQTGGFYNNNSVSFTVTNGKYYIVNCMMLKGWSNPNTIPTPTGCSVIGTIGEVSTSDSGFEGYYSHLKSWLVKATSTTIKLTGTSDSKAEYEVTLAQLP